MIKINAIKIEINTDSGLFGAEHKFESGFNIIRGDNTSGKSSLFQSIIYCLGFEELIGGKNEKTMQSVLKDIVEFPKGKIHRVLQSFILLEIENQHKDVITIKRSVISNSREPQLVEVFESNILTNKKDKIIEGLPMYVHDKGSASDDIFGFHMYLEKFLGWQLPYVYNKSGEKRKIYLQQVAPSFIIEQKTGWSDFLATMPFYSLTNKEARVIEFLLDLDVYENKQAKQNILSSKRLIEEKWNNLHKQFSRFAERGNGKLINFESKPSIINDTLPIKILLNYKNEDYTISDFIEIQNNLLKEIENKLIPKVSETLKRNEKKVDNIMESINLASLKYEMLTEEIDFDKDKFIRYNQQLESLNEDLRKNKGAQKVKKLGAEISSKVSKDFCPTCDQHINDSLLPIDVSQNPMLIEDNISYIEAQIKMIKVYIEGLNYKIKEKESRLHRIKLDLSNKRQYLRELKKELISDERLPSEIEIEKKINIKKRIEFYINYLNEFNHLIDEVEKLSNEYKEILVKAKDLPFDFFSSNDRVKLGDLLSEFKRLITKFDYKSKSNDFIDISYDNYLPVAQKQFGEDLKNYDLRFDSSASDFIRCIWAYTCSLYLTSVKYNANHPKLLMFDEPKQQDISISHFKSFLQELSSYREGQILLFASFENSEESYKIATEGLKFNLIHIKNKLIKPIKD